MVSLSNIKSWAHSIEEGVNAESVDSGENAMDTDGFLLEENSDDLEGNEENEGNEDYSSTLAWRIPWMDEPSRPQSMGSQRVRHN